MLDALLFGEKAALAVIVAGLSSLLVMALFGRHARSILVAAAAVMLPILLLAILEIGLSLHHRYQYSRNSPEYSKAQRAADIEAANVAARNGHGKRFGPYTVPPPVKSTFFNINSDGFRGGELTRSSRPTVIVLGGSAVFGAGVADDQTIPAKMKELLGDSADVVNLGMNSFVLEGEIFTFKQLAPKIQPTTAIYYHGVNDYARALQVHYGARLNGNALVETRPLHALAFFVSKNTEIGKGAAVLSAHMSDREAPSDDLIKRAAADFVSLQRSAQEACQELDIKCHFLLQPIRADKSPLGYIESRHAENEEASFPGHAAGYRKFREEVLRLSPETIDLSAAFNGYPYSLFNDYVHVIGRGNEIAARRILEALHWR